MTLDPLMPYVPLGVQHIEGMSFIRDNLSEEMTNDELLRLLLHFIQPLYYPGEGDYIRFDDVSEAQLDLKIVGGVTPFLPVDAVGLTVYTREKTFVVDTVIAFALRTSDTGFILQAFTGGGPILEDVIIPSDTREIRVMPDGKMYVRTASNPELTLLYQLVAVAFANPGGLNPIGDNYYQESMDSGMPVMGVPQDGGMFADTSIIFENASIEPVTKNDILSTASTSINNYICSALPGYSNEQMTLIKQLFRAVSFNNVDRIEAVLRDFCLNVTLSGLSSQEQAPLLIAVQIGISNLSYWTDEVSNMSSAWYVNGYFASDPTVNYQSIPAWVSAAISGSLSMVNSSPRIDGTRSPLEVTNINLVAILLGSLGVGAGKVILNLSQTSANPNSKLVV